jgi:hypothetical protein
MLFDDCSPKKSGEFGRKIAEISGLFPVKKIALVDNWRLRVR